LTHHADKRVGKRRLGIPQALVLVFVGAGFSLSFLSKRLQENILNASSSSNIMKSEFVNLAESKQQQLLPPPQNSQNNNIGSPTLPLTASTVLQMPLSTAVKIHKLSSHLKSCPNTIVTGYFQLRSKYTADTYLKWMKNMLSLQDCMVVLTSTNMVETIKTLRQHALDGTVIIEMQVDDLPIAQLHAEQMNPAFWPNQLEIDREKKRHKSYQLFWIWLSKTWCVVQAIQKDYFYSTFFMWQDIGAFRDQSVSKDGVIYRCITELRRFVCAGVVTILTYTWCLCFS
jgi:Bacterial protein of unknown function (HtrL_YibB)